MLGWQEKKQEVTNRNATKKACYVGADSKD